MKINDLKIGDKVKFVWKDKTYIGYIDHITDSQSYIKTTLNGIWGYVDNKNIISKLEEKEIPIDKPIKYEFIFLSDACGYEYLGYGNKMFINGRVDGYNFDTKMPFLGAKLSVGKRFKVTVEEIE